MAWDNAAKNLTAKVITMVESGLKYDANNYRDPITVGAFQWNGTRAASVLRRMRTENPSSWVGVASTIDAALDAHSNEDSWWRSRYLTTTEGNSIKPVLANNVAIQHDQAVIDFEGYKAAYVRQGGSAENNTQAMIFWFTMWHQTPQRALNVLRSAGINSTIDRLYTYCMNEPTFSQYRTRYTDARNIIKAGDHSGIDLFSTPGYTPEPVDPDEPVGEAPPDGAEPIVTTDLNYIRKHGNNLHLVMRGGETFIAYPLQANHWGFKVTTVEGVPTDPGTVPIEDDPTPPIVADHPGIKALAWVMSHLETWKYGQGPGRLNPFKSGYSDCSGTTYLAYLQTAGIKIGTYTTPQSKFGQLITTDREQIRAGTGLLPGDLIFYRNYVRAGWPYNHVEMYIGNAARETIGHPSGTGPSIHPMDKFLAYGKLAVMARRPWA